MNLKALFAVAALSLLGTVTVAEEKKAAPAADAKPAAAAPAADAKAAAPAAAPAADKVELKADADADAKAAIAAATAANDAAKKAGFEWFWKDKSASEHIQDAIKAANEGKKEDAIKLAKTVEAAGKQGVEQAEKAKTAGPAKK